MIKKILIFVSFLIITSCVSTKYDFRQDCKIEHLSVCIDYADNIDLSIKQEFDQRLKQAISQFNGQNHVFKIDFCQDITKSSLIIKVNETGLVDKKTQVKGVLVSLAGIALATSLIATNSSILLWFGYFPRDYSVLGLKLTNDLVSKDTTYVKSISNSGFLISKQTQISNHGLELNNFLIGELKQIEKQYKKIHMP